MGQISFPGVRATPIETRQVALAKILLEHVSVKLFAPLGSKLFFQDKTPDVESIDIDGFVLSIDQVTLVGMPLISSWQWNW